MGGVRQLRDKGRIISTTMRDQTFDRMRHHIMAGHLRPGDTVTAKSISETFDVGTMPAREALRQLVAVGALRMHKNRSASVPELSKQEFIDVINLRVSSEAYALASSIEKMTRKDLQHLRMVDGRQAKAAAADDFDAYLEYNLEFHFSLYRPCGSRPVLAMIERLWLLSGPRLSYLIEQQGILADSVSKHRDILNAVEARRVDQAESILVDDIRSAFDYIIDHFDESEIS